MLKKETKSLKLKGTLLQLNKYLFPFSFVILNLFQNLLLISIKQDLKTEINSV